MNSLEVVQVANKNDWWIDDDDDDDDDFYTSVGYYKPFECQGHLYTS